MASVYLAVQQSLGRHVALKVLHKFDNPVLSDRFLNEGKIIASLQHPNIVTIYDVGIVDDQHFIAMEYLHGGTLEDLIERGVSEREALDMMISIGRCLEFVHQHGLVHRDIKPANILFHKDGTLKLTDFGVAKDLMVDKDITMDGTALGSPYYISPEQAEGKTPDGRSDLYSLGVIFYEMLTGRKPYIGESAIETILAHLNQPIPDLPEELAIYQKLIDRMLEKQPDHRFSSAGEMVGYLNAIHDLHPRNKGHKVDYWGKITTLADYLPVTGNWRNDAIAASLLSVALILMLVDFSDPQPAIIQGPVSVQADIDTQQKKEPGNISEPQKIIEKTVEATGSVDQGETDGNEFAARVEIDGSDGQAAPIVEEQLIELDAPVVVEAEAISDGSLSVLDTDDADVSVALEGKLPATEVLQPSPVGILVAFNQDDQIMAVDQPVKKVPEKSESSVEDLLRKGDVALAEFRLTTPSLDSAFYYYTLVLEYRPGNAHAQQGLVRIADAYEILINQQLLKGNINFVERYLKRGLAVKSDHVGLLQIEEKLYRDQTAGATNPTRVESPTQTAIGKKQRQKGFFDFLESIYDPEIPLAEDDFGN